jgi:hypothetical protein
MAKASARSFSAEIRLTAILDRLLAVDFNLPLRLRIFAVCLTPSGFHPPHVDTG